MALICEIGQVYESCGEVNVEWKIPDFFSLSGDGYNYYQSPVFFLSDSYWRLRMYPNGAKDSKEWVGLFVQREDSGPSKSVFLNFGIKSTQAQLPYKSGTVKFTEKSICNGFPRFISISDLKNQKSQLAPSDVFTVICSIKRDFPCPTEACLSTRLWNLSRDLKRMLDEGKGADFTLKVKEGRELRAHRKILEARCGYFAGMLANDFQENASGMADIDDIEEGVFQCILTYLYTGDPVGIVDQNVCKIYVAAHKMLLEDLKKLCVHYMKGNLSVDVICDVIAVLEKYDETDLNACTLDFFTKHAKEVFDSDGWKNLKKFNSPLVATFLEKFAVWKKS